MKAKKYLGVYAIALLMGGMLCARPLQAATVSTDTEVEAADGTVSVDVDVADVEEPAFTSPEEVEAAIQEAEEEATQAPAEVEEALQDVEEASTALEEAQATEDPEAIEQALEQLSRAEEAFAEAISELAGVDKDAVEAMREDGIGWGKIANELGVQPGLLGLGNTLGKQNHGEITLEDDREMRGVDPEELAEATARDLDSADSLDGRKDIAGGGRSAREATEGRHGGVGLDSEMDGSDDGHGIGRGDTEGDDGGGIGEGPGDSDHGGAGDDGGGGHGGGGGDGDSDGGEGHGGGGGGRR
ncbi:hypothetical protein [Desulfolithobacter sp.]